MERHSVGISYTGIDGRTTEFKSSSADEAFGRLSGISGFLRNEGDAIAESAVKEMSLRDRKSARVNAFRESGSVPRDPMAAFRSSSDSSGITSVRVVTGITFGRWGYVTSYETSTVRPDGKGGLVICDSQTVANDGPAVKEVEQMWKNYNTMWQWWGKYGQYYRG